MRFPLLPRWSWFWLLAALSLAAAAQTNETPAILPGATIATAEQVKRLLDSGVIVVDTRVGNEFAESHIRGAINVPYKERSQKAIDFNAALDTFNLGKLPADKAQPIVFYCNSGDCWKSYKAATVALRAGYRQVVWFRGGYPEWHKKGLPVE